MQLFFIFEHNTNPHQILQINNEKLFKLYTYIDKQSVHVFVQCGINAGFRMLGSFMNLSLKYPCYINMTGSETFSVCFE